MTSTIFGSEDKQMNPLSTQVGGAHYKNYKIQPVEYAMANNLNYCQANAIKYITRYRDKNGLEDLRKAIHNLEILMELEYGADYVRSERVRSENKKEQESNCTRPLTV